MRIVGQVEEPHIRHGRASVLEKYREPILAGLRELTGTANWLHIHADDAKEAGAMRNWLGGNAWKNYGLEIKRGGLDIFIRQRVPDAFRENGAKPATARTAAATGSRS